MALYVQYVHVQYDSFRVRVFTAQTEELGMGHVVCVRFCFHAVEEAVTGRAVQ